MATMRNFAEDYARRLLSAKPEDLPRVTEEIAREIRNLQFTAEGRYLDSEERLAVADVIEFLLRPDAPPGELGMVKKADNQAYLAMIAAMKAALK